MNKKAFGKRIQKVRKSRGLTARMLAEMISIDDTFLRQIEGGRALPSLPVFISICNALEASPDYFLRDSITTNELTKCEELLKMWEDATPMESQLIVDMIMTARKYID